MKQRLRSFLIKILKIDKNDLKDTSITEESKENIGSVKIIEEQSHDVSLKMTQHTKEKFESSSEKLKVSKPKKVKEQQTKTPKLPELTAKERAARDLSEMMEVPFLALSKNRIRPITYERRDGKNTMHVRVSPHTEHFMASIYDWDIILFVAGKIQKTINDGSDIPPRKVTFLRYEILKELKKHDGKKEELDLKAALSRLQSTRIETNIRNEDCRHGSVFSFIDGWGYTTREDVREMWVNLSDWLYEGICVKGSLLMVDPEYFSMTSGLKRFLYRTARKHVGIKGGSWEFLLETLHKKSGSEMELKYFKRELKSAVLENDIPGYCLDWIERDKKIYVIFNNIAKQNNNILNKEK